MYDTRELVDSVEGFRAIALQHRLHASWKREFPRHADNPGIVARYFTRDVIKGISPDDLGEFWFDAGLLDSRPSESEVIDRLDAIFERSSRRTGEESERAVYSQQDAIRAKIAKTRNYNWRCQCGAIAFYASAGALGALHVLHATATCPECGYRVTRRSLTLAEFDAGVTLSDVQAPGWNPMKRCNGIAGDSSSAVDSEPVPF